MRPLGRLGRPCGDRLSGAGGRLPTLRAMEVLTVYERFRRAMWIAVLAAIAATSGPAVEAAASPSTLQAEGRALADLAAEIRRADYLGERDELSRLAASIEVEAGSAELAPYRAYWRGFAAWRRALNGFNLETALPDLLADLESAAADFRLALAADPTFEDAHSALLGALYSQLFLHMPNPPRELVAEGGKVIAALRAASSPNPRTLWMLGSGEAYSPPPYGGDLAKAAATFRRGLEAARREAVGPAPPPWVPRGGSPELMMSLAYLYTRPGVENPDLARSYALGALAIVPDWRFVAETLLPAIDRLELDLAARPQADRAAIAELHARDEEASRAMDHATLASLWTDDVAALSPDGVVVRGRAANAARLEELTAAMAGQEIVDYDLYFEEVEVRGDWAFEWGTYAGTTRDPSSGAPRPLQGRLMRILQRQGDGAWRVARTMYTPPQSAGDAASVKVLEGAVTVTKTLGAARRLELEVEVPASAAEVWEAISTADGLTTWITPDARVDLRPGGEWLALYPGAAPGGGTITHLEPGVALRLRALAPEQFPEVRRVGTDALFQLEARGDQTLVRLRQTGWGEGAEWDAAFAYLARGNAVLLEALRRRFIDGPRQWPAPRPEVASAHRVPEPPAGGSR
jgi:ketosteroid isomerase-like protein/uncharacterized protein YndB with AHSA1/START domain